MAIKELAVMAKNDLLHALFVVDQSHFFLSKGFQKSLTKGASSLEIQKSMKIKNPLWLFFVQPKIYFLIQEEYLAMVIEAFRLRLSFNASETTR